MTLGKIFWVVSVSTLILLGLFVAGYNVLPLILALLIIDVLVLKAFDEKKGHATSLKVITDMNSKLASIHSVLLDMGNFLRESRKGGNVQNPVQNPGANIVTLGAIEKTLNRHKEEIRKEFKEDIDKIAEKIIDVENRLFDMRKGFSAAIAAFDDRMRSIEEGEISEEHEESPAPEEDYVEI